MRCIQQEGLRVNGAIDTVAMLFKDFAGKDEPRGPRCPEPLLLHTACVVAQQLSPLSLRDTQ